MATVQGIPKLAEIEYKILRELGSGAGSSILLIADTRTSKQYALKVVRRLGPDDDIYITQAQHEFEVAQRLNHRCLVKIYDCRVKKSWLKVTGAEELMEFVDGRTLDDIALKQEIGQLVLVFNQVAAGLMHMHRRGIYHGDLKPSNVLLSRDGQVKVIDFGTAWIKGQPKNRVQGTPQYMAPEQGREKIVDEKTDLYNFGAMMYRLLTGEYANLGMAEIGGSPRMGRSRMQTPIDCNPEVPGTLSEAVMACLEINPDRRPAGVFELRHQLVAAARYLGLKEDDLQGSEGREDEI